MGPNFYLLEQSEDTRKEKMGLILMKQ
jgi:hypothetical protein